MLTKTRLRREMTAPAGCFYTAQDADSFVTAQDPEPEEGAFYVWSYSELSKALSKAALNALAEAFTLSVAGNFEGQNVLQRHHSGSLSDAAEAALESLFQRRYETALVKIAADSLPSLVTRYTPTEVFQDSNDLPPDTVGLVCERLHCKPTLRIGTCCDSS